MIALCDLGLENLKRLQRMFERLGYMAVITSDPEEIACCDCVVLSGTGNISQGFNALKKTRLDRLIPSLAKRGKQIVGIGLGAHLLCRGCQENGWYKGLDLLPIDVVSGKRTEGFLRVVGDGALNGIDSAFYFDQSGYVCDRSNQAMAYHDGEFAAVKIEKNVAAIWFYPHKSGADGLCVMTKVLNLAENGGASL